MNTLADFTRLVQLCISAAAEKFGELPDIDIRYDLKGRAAGQAMHDGRGNFAVRFNREAMQMDWEHMVKETIPHEIAHIVAFAKPELGASGHNAMWQRIAQSLGCKGDRCHTMKLTPAKKRRFFLYILDSGERVKVARSGHEKIQRFGTAARYKLTKTNEYVDSRHFIGEIPR